MIYRTQDNYTIDSTNGMNVYDLIVKLKPATYDKYPYLDTLKYYTPIYGELSSTVYSKRKKNVLSKIRDFMKKPSTISLNSIVGGYYR